MKMAVFWDVFLCSLVGTNRRFKGTVIALMMEAVSSSEALVRMYQTTWCNIPEDSHLHTCHLVVLCPCVPLAVDLFAREMWPVHWLAGVWFCTPGSGCKQHYWSCCLFTFRGWGNPSSAKILLQIYILQSIKHFLETNVFVFAIQASS
jgi:hypothetical protein